MPSIRCCGSSAIRPTSGCAAAALEGIGKLKTPAAAVVLIEAVRQETGAVRAIAEAQLKKLSGDEMAALVRQARDAEIGERREILDRVMRALR